MSAVGFVQHELPTGYLVSGKKHMNQSFDSFLFQTNNVSADDYVTLSVFELQLVMFFKD